MLLAKMMLPGSKQIVRLVLVLIKIFAILIDGTRTSNIEKINNNVRDIDEPHTQRPGHDQSLYLSSIESQSQLKLNQRKRAQDANGELEGEKYNHQSDDQYDSGTAHHNSQHHFDEPEFSVPLHGNEDRLTDQQHASNAPFSETVLSSSGNVTNRVTSQTTDSNSFELNENNLADNISLTRELIERTCQLDRGSQRSEQLNNTFLTYCSRYKLENLLSNEILMSIMHHDSRDCEKILDEFVQLDETINQFDSLFMKLLSRYNCHNGYSVKWNCDDCKKAYKDWLCSTHLPFYMNGERIKPCISFCERVEQRCPYLHPITREQYGGQPVFICRDPNIPFVPAITPDIPYSEPGKCYDLCHLSDNLTELIIDSLSKYDYDKCPDRGSIAGEVRSEQVAAGLPNIQNGQKNQFPGDSGDYPDSTYSEDGVVLTNQSDFGGGRKVLIGHNERKTTHVHNKKLEELREVLANYKNQAKTHRYHADHSSIDHSKAQQEIHSS